MKELHLLFGKDDPYVDSLRFIEAENAEGRSVNAGEWRDRADGYVELVITELPEAPAGTTPSTRPRLEDHVRMPHAGCIGIAVGELGAKLTCSECGAVLRAIVE
jgi:hypothetical protein